MKGEKEHDIRTVTEKGNGKLVGLWGNCVPLRAVGQ